MKTKADVLIIGAGIVGLSTAYYLAKEGRSVIVLEKTDGSDSCSHGNAGFISPSHFVPLASPGIVSKGLRWMLNPESPFYIKPRLNTSLIKWGLNFVRNANTGHVERTKQLFADMSHLSRELHIDFAKTENVVIQNKGVLMQCSTEADMYHERELAKMAADLGIDTRILSIDELDELDPKVRHSGVGAVYFPGDSWMVPKDFIVNMKKALNELGVEIHYNQEVKGFNIDKAVIKSVQTDDLEFKGDEIVLAAGAFTPVLSKLMGNRLLLEAGKGYSVDYQDSKMTPNLAYILVEARVAVTPMERFVRIAGTMELGGLNLDINPRRVAGFLKSVNEYLPDFDYEKARSLPVWAGLRPCSPDGLPYVGRDSKYKNLIVAAGHAMLGFTLGPVSGKLVTEIIEGRQTSLKIDQLAVNRY
jgi:D-amino-acid dehydrogenase